jgi:protein-tyrosine kinase
MSRIHEALKRAEREKGRGGAQPPAEATPAAAATPVAPPPGAPASAPTPAPAAAPAAVHTAAPAAGSSTAATTVMTRAAAMAPALSAPPSMLDGCRRAGWQGDASKLFFLNSKSQTFATEQLRMLRSRLYQARERRPLKAVLVTSAMAAEGKTFICANLAHAIARQTDRRVLLVDCDFRSPSLHTILGAPAAPGLAGCLKGEAQLEQVLQRGPLDNLFLIPAGGTVANPGDMFSRGKLKTLLSHLAPLFDWILLDAPAAGLFPDALAIADQADGVLLVVEGGRTPYDAALGAVRELREKHLLGVVLNRARVAGTTAAHAAGS